MFFHIDHAEIPGQQLLRQPQPDHLIIPFLRNAVQRVFHALIEPGHGCAPVFGGVVEQDKGRVGFQSLQILFGQKGIDGFRLLHVNHNIFVLAVDPQALQHVVHIHIGVELLKLPGSIDIVRQGRIIRLFDGQCGGADIAQQAHDGIRRALRLAFSQAEFQEHVFDVVLIQGDIGLRAFALYIFPADQGIGIQHIDRILIRVRLVLHDAVPADDAAEAVFAA